MIAHAIMMGVAFAVLFPLGSIILRAFKSKRLVWIHGAWQVFALSVALAAFGMGVWMAYWTGQYVTPNGHAIVGTIVIAMLLMQVSR